MPAVGHGLLERYALLVPSRVKRRRGFTRLSSKRQITLPKGVVESAGLSIGEELSVESDSTGRVIVSRIAGESIGDRRRRALGKPPEPSPASGRWVHSMR